MDSVSASLRRVPQIKNNVASPNMSFCVVLFVDNSAPHLMTLILKFHLRVRVPGTGRIGFLMSKLATAAL